ncbi:unnamed protein product [Parnassius apollo]|uniref:(apollo) hypothetical protein n=1 Tax=Parnassius apollo TaxID=110799 RepID=A0A8S3WC22_PARAO|nr:unnamed protein product [Parnassius apollo]
MFLLLNCTRTLIAPRYCKRLPKKHIQCYFDRFNRNISDAVKLYESRYLLILRSTTFVEDTYLKGFCKASMKQLQYEKPRNQSSYSTLPTI